MRANVKPITDPREMVETGTWMRWETYLRKTGWRYPEKVIATAMLHDWYLPRTPNYPNWSLPPAHIHLPIESYRKEDVLCPYWVGPLGTGQAHCPRCENPLEGQLQQCPNCNQRLGGYHTYSAS